MLKTGLVAICVTLSAATFGACTKTRAASEVVAVEPAKPAVLPPAQPAEGRPLRTLGTIAAQRALSIQVPRISGQGGGITLVQLIPNGSVVHTGDVLAEFDGTAQVKTQRDAQAKYDDLSHQVEQKIAEDHSNAAKRATDFGQAMADLEKARLDARQEPVDFE
jgi:multidrug efflux pump subunit AcrA (membrane-fusion protein)